MSTATERKVLELVSSYYEAAYETGADWHSIYAATAQMVGSGAGGIGVLVNTTDECNIFGSTIDASLIESYNSHFRHISPLRHFINRARSGERVSRIERISNEDFEMTEIYNDFFKKIGIYEIEYHALCGAPGLTGCISFSRPRSSPRFSVAQRAKIDLIIPHLQRVMMIHLYLNEARRSENQFTDMLNATSRGIMTIDRNERVVFSNATMNRILAKKDGLDIDRNGKLFASRSEENACLRLKLDSVFSPAPDNSHLCGGVVNLRRADGKRPLQILITPFKDHNEFTYYGDTLALCFVHDPDEMSATDEDSLCDVYSLTPTEGKIAAMVVDGKSLTEISDELMTSVNTVRTHLKHIFSKTGTNRQSELIRLILSGPATLQIKNKEL